MRCHPVIAALAMVLSCGSLVMAGCASSHAQPPQAGPDDAIVPKRELSRLRAAAARVDTLEQRLAAVRAGHAALEETVRRYEERLGMRQLRPTTLTRGAGRLRLPDALRVDALDARPRRSALKRHLGGTQRGAVIAYWATWCVPCTAPEELALLRTMRTQLKRGGVDLLSMAVDGIEKVQGDARASRWLYPLWQKDQAHFEMLPKRFIQEAGVDLPLFLVVGKDGDIRWWRRGALDELAVHELVTMAIHGKAATR